MVPMRSIMVSAMAPAAAMSWSRAVWRATVKLPRSGSMSARCRVASLIAIRTRRVPFFESRPSTPLVVSTLACVGVGICLPYSPLAGSLGFTALPAAFLAVLVGMIAVYLLLIELARLPAEQGQDAEHPPADAQGHAKRGIEP